MKIKKVATIIMFCLGGIVSCGEPIETINVDGGTERERNAPCLAQCEVQEAYANCESEPECCEFWCNQ